MPDVGDEVLVMPSLGENVAVQLGNVNIGDSVILYQLKDNTRIAVPTLSLSINSVVFNTPSFQFAGFNWNIDFNFELIPLQLFLLPGVYGIVKIDSYSMPYGDPSYNNNLITTNPAYSKTTMMGYQGWFIASWKNGINLSNISNVEIWEATGFHEYKLDINPNDYIYPNEYYWKPSSESESYLISFIYPNMIRIYCIASYEYQTDVGHIMGCLIRI